MRSFSRTALPVLVVLALWPGAAPRADGWPQWRGPQRDGVWRETGIVDAIPATGIPVRWRARIGSGYSGPAVAKGRVYVTDRKTDPEVERVVCFDEAKGNPLWVHAYACPYDDMEYGNGPRITPTVHDGKVYTLGTKGHLFCLDAAKGDVLWKKELEKDFKGRVPRYGVSAAPLVVDDLLIVCAGGEPDASVIALNRHTGELRWKALKDRPAYSPPVLVAAGGVKQLIVWTADNVSGLEPATGKVFWQVPRKTTFDEAEVVADPVLYKDRLLCMGAWSRGSLMLQLDAGKPAASVVWRTKLKPTTTINTPLFADDDVFYGVEGDGRLCCFEASSGEEVWSTHEPTSRRMGSAHLTPNGSRVFLFNQSGHLILARLSPKGYQELGRTLLVEPTAGYRAQGAVAWAHPAYANQCVFARNDRVVVCASLAAEQVVVKEAPPPKVKARLLTEFAGRNAALGLAFSSDRKTLALGTWQGTVKLLDLATSKELSGPARHKDWVCTVAFSPDGKHLASAGGNEFKPVRNKGKTTGEVKLWDVAGKTERALDGHTNKVFAATFSPDNRTLATGGADYTVRLWDVATGQSRRVLEGHKGAVRSVVFTPDSKTLIAADAEGDVTLWDAETGKPRRAFKAHDEEVLAVAITRDGTMLATGSADWTIRLWDLAAEKPIATLSGHQGAVYGLAFTSDGKTLASCSGDETVRIWDVAKREPRMVLRGHRSGVTAITLAPDERTLASAGMDDAVRLWDLHGEP